MSQINQIAQESLDYYLNLRYPITLYLDNEGGYTAEIKELHGCLTQGETIEEAVENIEDARVLWIKTAYDYGDDIPLPATETQFSGKVLLRMPRSLHSKLVAGAEREGASLNQYIVSLLSEENTSRKIFSIISKQLSDWFKTMKFKGIKQGRTITLSEDILNISDGAEIDLEIPASCRFTREEREEQLESVLGIWKEEAEIKQIFTEIDEEPCADVRKSSYPNDKE